MSMQRTKIDERRERKDYDRAHPWQPVGSAKTNTGIVCELLFSDMETSRDRHFFLGEDDRWYLIDPPTKVIGWSGRNPMNWRPVHPARKLTPGRRAEIITTANKRDW